jgi:D-methionine transport system permease protein
MPEVMAAVVLVLVVLVQAIQSFGETLARRVNKRVRRT